MSAIATFYTEAQFRVDFSGLTKFRQEMTLVKTQMGGTLELISKTATSLKGLMKSFEKVQGSFDARAMISWRKSIAAAARAYVKVMEASNGVLHQVAQEASKSQIKLSNFEKRLNSNIVALNSYAQALMPVVLLLERLRGAAGSPLPRVGGGFRGGANGAGGAGQGGHGGAGRPPSGAGTGLLETAGIMAFLKPMLPMGMGLGGMLGGGYAFRELIGAGREMFAMELKMKAVSKSSEAFANNMKYVRELSQQLGLDLVGAGNAYAQIVVTAQEKMNPEQMQKMFTGFNKYYATVHMTAEDQRLANLAIQQMFGKDKIQAQEARLQMGQRVTPFIKLLTEAAKEKLGDKFTTFDDVMKRGLLDPATLLPVVADKLTIIANTGGSLAEALQNSQVAQARFNNSLKEFSYIVMKGGLDHALAVMFAYGSEAVPMAAKAMKGLLHSIKNTFNFLSVAITDTKVLLAGLVAYFLGLTVAAMASILGSTAAMAAFTAGIGIATRATLVLLSTLKSVAIFVKPIALALTAIESLSILVDTLEGKDISNSWIIGLISWVDLLFNKISYYVSKISLEMTMYRNGTWWLPDDTAVSGENGDGTSKQEYIKKQNKWLYDPSKGSIMPKPVDNRTNYLNYNTDTPNIAVNITLPQMTAEQANMLGSGDVKGFSISMGDAAYRALRDYNPYIG